MLSRNGQRQGWWPECVQPPSNPSKLAAQLKSPFGDSCSSLFTRRARRKRLVSRGVSPDQRNEQTVAFMQSPPPLKKNRGGGGCT